MNMQTTPVNGNHTNTMHSINVGTSNLAAPLKILDINEMAARVKLTELTRGWWLPVRMNKRETDALNEKHGTEDAARVGVRQSDHPALKRFISIVNRGYMIHEELTVPSVQKGMRIITNGKEFEHSKRMHEIHTDAFAQVEVLCRDYEAHHVRQRAKLGDLYDARAWPRNADQLRALFTYRVRYLACPTEGAWKDWLAESAKCAEAEVEERLTKVLTHVAERCKSEGPLFRSVFDNLRELLELVPDLDITGKYADVVNKAKVLAKYNAEDIREDKDARETIAKRAEKLAGMFAGLAS